MPVKRHPIAATADGASLTGLPIDTALIGRLKATYDRVRSNELRLAEVFYAKLFAAAPPLRQLFRGDPNAQAQKLTAALDAVVRNLEHPAENAAMLAALGRRHADYGAKPEHYGLVIDLLVESMREILGSTANLGALEEWRLALQLISKQMIAATEQPDE
ncbi:MAG: globin domain-containing protein [Phycisphaerales bacterium]